MVPTGLGVSQLWKLDTGKPLLESDHEVKTAHRMLKESEQMTMKTALLAIPTM